MMDRKLIRELSEAYDNGASLDSMKSAKLVEPNDVRKGDSILAVRSVEGRVELRGLLVGIVEVQVDCLVASGEWRLEGSSTGAKYKFTYVKGDIGDPKHEFVYSWTSDEDLFRVDRNMYPVDVKRSYTKKLTRFFRF